MECSLARMMLKLVKNAARLKLSFSSLKLVQYPFIPGFSLPLRLCCSLCYVAVMGPQAQFCDCH